MPLLRELRSLASRALITLPPDVDDRLVGPDDVQPPRTGVIVSPARTAAVGARSQDDDGTDLIRGLAGTSDRATNGDTFGLSNREREVLLQIARGRTNREIGERLFISQKTVGVHVGNILSKLGVSGRVEAAAVAIRLGMTDRP
jgi:DNA-binding CsgD family transcriptional regulator